MSPSRVSKYCDVLSSNIKLTSEKIDFKNWTIFPIGWSWKFEQSCIWMKIWWDVTGILCQIVFGALFKDLFSNGISASFLSSEYCFFDSFHPLRIFGYVSKAYRNGQMTPKYCVLHAKNFSKNGLTDMISGLQLRYYSENPQLCASGFYFPSFSHQTSPLPCEGCNWAFGISSLPSQPLYFLTCLYTSVSSFFIIASGILLFFSFSLAYIAKNL